MKLPSIDRLHELFRVDEAGNLVRKTSNPNAHYKEGDIAGGKNAWGHLKVMVDCVMVYNHRIVWAMTYGEWPSMAIDHINGDGSDNRLCNMRLASDEENNHNRGKNKNNRTGYRGVCFDNRRKAYMAQITVGGRGKYLGHFKTAVQASDAYEAEAKILHGKFYRPKEAANG